MRASLKLKLSVLRYLMNRPRGGLCYYVAFLTQDGAKLEAELTALFLKCGLHGYYPFNRNAREWMQEVGRRLRNPLRRKFIFRLLTDRLGKYKA